MLWFPNRILKTGGARYSPHEEKSEDMPNSMRILFSARSSAATLTSCGMTAFESKDDSLRFTGTLIRAVCPKAALKVKPFAMSARHSTSILHWDVGLSTAFTYSFAIRILTLVPVAFGGWNRSFRCNCLGACSLVTRLAQRFCPAGIRGQDLHAGAGDVSGPNWARRAGQNAPDLLPDYEGSVGSMLKLLRSIEGRSEGDPRKIADVIVKLANSDEVPVRLILGVDAEKRVHQAEAARAIEAEKWRYLTLSTVFEDAESIPALLKH